MPNYQNSIIYKLCHQDDLENNNIYVGSTTNFRMRKFGHKTACNNEKDKNYNIFVYNYIRDNGGWNNFVMIPIEVYPCNDKKELEVRERHHIELLKPTLNKVIPTRTLKEYYKDNKENLAEKAKKYYEDNKEVIIQKVKGWYETNKEKKAQYDKQYHIDNKEKKAQYDKQYYEDKKEKKINISRQYYKNNKDKIAEKQKEKIVCDNCGCEVRKNGLIQHQKSNKCKNYNITKE